MSENFDSLSETDCCAVIIDKERLYLISSMNDVDSLALVCCASDDPSNIDDLALVWRRATFHGENAEFFDALPMRSAALNEAVEIARKAAEFLVLDLAQSRVLTGGSFPKLRLRRDPADEDDESFAETIVLPPWWELRQCVDAEEILNARTGPVVRLDPRRDVLWGRELTRFLARRMIDVARSGEPWTVVDDEGQERAKYDHTLAVHRAWLLTPRDDLQGGAPRERLHIAKNWIDDLSDGQRFRLDRGGQAVPVPEDLSTFASAAMGSHEVIMYFDACRESIAVGWSWLMENDRDARSPDVEARLESAMHEFLSRWLTMPFEGGRPPDSIIRHERMRVPMVARREDHVFGCDCPICEMMFSGDFGPMIAGFDGHHLELDDDFAFSLEASREAWDKKQAAWAKFNEEFEAKRLLHGDGDHEYLTFGNEHASTGDEYLDEEDDEFDSVWMNGHSDGNPIPGDTHGHMSMAFRVAELVSWLQFNDGDSADIKELNRALREHREAFSTFDDDGAAGRFKQVLEFLAEKYPELQSQAADLQSQIDEQIRDVPF